MKSAVGSSKRAPVLGVMLFCVVALGITWASRHCRRRCTSGISSAGRRDCPDHCGGRSGRDTGDDAGGFTQCSQ